MQSKKQKGATTTIRRKRVQHVILLFKILKASEAIAQRLTPALRRKGNTNDIVNGNLNISVFAFIIRQFYQLLVQLYERKKARLYRQAKRSYKNRGYDHLPKSKWSNDFPVILVHGFAGWAPDEGPIWGDYWAYMSDPDVIKHHKVYQADVGPFNSLHDRACELYQQIVGIVHFKANRDLKDNGPSLARAVYGEGHFDKEHAPHQTFYKPRYLRQVQRKVGKIYGFPMGVPNGWSAENKIHFVAHSQGAPTVRYLQYLLSIDYFALPGQPKVDKSNWIASVTAISGCLNGSLGPYASCINEKFLLQSDKRDGRTYFETLAADVMSNGFKAFATAQNIVEPAGTQEVEPENIVKVFKQKPQTGLKSILVDKSRGSNNDIMYELGNQYGMLMDLNHERAGFNKRKDESHIEYINRLSDNDFAGQSHDHAIPEFPPGVFEQRNVLLQTHQSTYYFAISSGEKKQRFLNCKEYQTEPEKTTKMAMGFDSDVIQNLKLVGSIRKIKQNGKERLGSWDRIYSFFRWFLNPLSVYHKLYLPNFMTYKQPKYLDNLFNPSMNNATSLDYSNYSQTIDNDGVLARWTTEYPRMSMRYLSKAHTQHAPWGQKSRPIRFDCWQETPLSLQHSCERETTLGGQTFERGIWYYSGLELIDHHDFSGLENPWAVMETIAGRETRPQFCINVLNRLRMLDFTSSDSASDSAQRGILASSTCTQCKHKLQVQKDFAFGSEPSTSVPDSASDISYNGSDHN